MKTIGRTSSILLAGVLALAVLAGGWFGLVKPKKDQVNAMKAQLIQQQTDNETLQMHVSLLKSMAKQLPQQQAELVALQAKVPNQVQLSALMRQLVEAAKTSGVTLTGFAPQAPQDLAGAPGIKYVDVVLNFTGGYADVAAYDTALEGLSRTLMVKSFTLAGASGSGSAGTSSSTSSADTVTATFNGRVLVRDDSAGSKASPSAPGSAGTANNGSSGTSSSAH